MEKKFQKLFIEMYENIKKIANYITKILQKHKKCWKIREKIKIIQKKEGF